jgi:alginate O-acetyltransferase complex protein AlgI
MDIISGVFAGFVLLVVVVYYPLPRRLQNIWLLIASYVFYVTWAWQFAAVLLALTAVNFGLARLLRPGDRPPRPGLLWLGIAINVLALAFFKYAGFFVSQWMALFHISGDPGALQIVLPVGMSYLILQMISYLVDTYRGQMPEGVSAVDFALFAAYFPKLVSGPIERARDFLPQLAKDRVVDNEALARSITLIVVGLVRKTAIAAFLAPLAATLLDRPGKSGISGMAVGLVFYAVFLYNDFAGYTGIVRGVSGLMGIELSANFMTPFFARNFTEFWNRWHISLSHWLRDYIYFPISRALLRKDPDARRLPNLVVAPLVTMLISGLWHGAALNLLVWGLLHGLFQAVERLGSLWVRPTPPDKWPLWRQIGGGLTVFVLATAAWLPFRDPDFLSGRFLRALTSGAFKPDQSGAIAAALIAISLLMDWVQYRSQDEAGFMRWPRLAQSAALALAVLMIFVSLLKPIPAFVYQGF